MHPQKSSIAILTSDKIYLKIKRGTRFKDGHFIMNTGAIHQEDITLINIDAPNLGVCMCRNILRHKTNFSKFKKIEIIPSIFSDHNSIKLEINSKKKARKNTNMKYGEINNMPLNNYWFKEKIKEDIKRCMETNENKSTTY